MAMADLTNAFGAIKKLNYYNYTYGKTCTGSYLKGQDLEEVIGGERDDNTQRTSRHITQMKSRKGQKSNDCVKLPTHHSNEK